MIVLAVVLVFVLVAILTGPAYEYRIARDGTDYISLINYYGWEPHGTPQSSGNAVRRVVPWYRRLLW